MGYGPARAATKYLARPATERRHGSVEYRRWVRRRRCYRGRIDNCSGADAEETWQQLLERWQRGIRKHHKPFVEEFKSAVRIGGVLREDFDEHLTRVELRRLSFMQKMSTVLGRRLWDTAGSPEIDTKRLLVSITQALATTETLVFLYDDWKARGMRAASPLAVQMHMPNAPAAAVGLDRGAKAGTTSPRCWPTPPARNEQYAVVFEDPERDAVITAACNAPA